MVPAGSTVKTTSLVGSPVSLDDSLLSARSIFDDFFGQKKIHRQSESKSTRMMMVTFEIPEAELPAMREAVQKLLEELS
jgi:hypothetical protein